MKNIILCSSNPILIKSVYGILRDEGFNVEIVEHPAFAVQRIINKSYDFLIFGSEPFGLSADDAADIIERLAPGTRILFVGSSHRGNRNAGAPLDLEEFKRTIHSIGAC